MQRYKIMLVDDETDVRDSIARTVDWESSGFTLCGTAGGALEALEMAARLLPDVVMTDICMPYMDGLELIDQLRSLYPAMQFVVVSGHDDFAYAQRALQYQVMDYLLKPLSHDGMKETLNKIRTQLDAAMANRRNLELLAQKAERDRWELARLQLMGLLYEDILQPGVPCMEIIRFPAWLGVMETVDAQEYDRVLTQDFNGRHELLQQAFLSVAKEILQETSGGTCLMHRNRLVLLLNGSKDDCIRTLMHIIDTLRMYLHLSCKAALSAKIDEPGDISGMYMRTVLLVQSGATFNAGSLFVMEEMPASGNHFDLLEKMPTELIHLVRSGDEKRLTSYFDSVRVRMNSTSMDVAHLETLYTLMRATVYSAALRSGVDEDALVRLMERTIVYPLEPQSVLQALQELSYETLNLISEQRTLSSKQIAASIADYIGQNFCNAGLSIPDVCAKFSISQTQLSLLFKREMGTSFLQYVLEKRITRAQELLRDTDKRIYEIALETGFEDPGYFSYCFKQRTGLTPKNFRQGANKQNA